LRYRAKVDWWIGVAIVVGLMLPLVMANFTTPWLYGAAAVPWVIVFGLCYPQSYETTAEGLLIRAGLMRRLIPYGSITRAEPSRDARSSMALSLDRVRIVYGDFSREVFLSPVEKSAFLEDLAKRAPQLR
jgi:hypothetical protein